MINNFNFNKINQMLKQSGLENYTVIYHDQLESTQSYALNNIQQLNNNSVIVCEVQTNGIGRNGKIWSSKPYIDIAVSLVHAFSLDFEYELLPLVIAVAINRLFKQLRVNTKVKWPNDIYLADKTKVAGILQSAKVYANERYIVTGIGLDNIQNWDRNNLLLSLIIQVENVLSEYKIFGFAIFRQEWLDNCIHYHRQISLYRSGNLIDCGIHVDLTNNGKIVVKDHTGLREYSGSSISLIVED
ncbi:MAG: biotin--[acetyl-CoA-carboxylase] ligase [Burkholderiales bacterium]|jgi:BirA family biotin operon repressor/biotin-[acetyl-CoA-carboxylase] ligase|nr:biotin--[acetyl-CoA-carboxylase] ligase [Burkholderiales bacterium]